MKTNYIDEILKEFDEEFIGALDKIHNKLYFDLKQKLKEVEQKTKQEIIERIKEIPTEDPERESDDFDYGLKEMREKFLEIIKNK